MNGRRAFPKDSKAAMNQLPRSQQLGLLLLLALLLLWAWIRYLLR